MVLSFNASNILVSRNLLAANLARSETCKDDHSELVHVQVDVPIVLCNFTHDLVPFVGFSMCNVLIFQKNINFHCSTSRIFTFSYYHLSISSPPKPSKSHQISYFVVVVAHAFFQRYRSKVLHWPRALCKRVWKSYLQRRFWRTIWRRTLDKWHVMSHRLKESLRKFHCWSSQNPQINRVFDDHHVIL